MDVTGLVDSENICQVGPKQPEQLSEFLKSLCHNPPDFISSILHEVKQVEATCAPLTERYRTSRSVRDLCLAAIQSSCRDEYDASAYEFGRGHHEQAKTHQHCGRVLFRLHQLIEQLIPEGK